MPYLERLDASKYCRKNKVYKYDLSSYDETLALPKSVSRGVAIRLMTEDSDFKRLCWDVWFWVEFINIFLATVLETIDMIQTTMEGSLIDLFKMMPCVGYLMLSMAKSFKLIWRRPVFENLMKELRAMWPQREVTLEEHLLLSKSLKQLRYVSKGYYWGNVGLSLAFAALPYVVIVQRIAGKNVPLMLSFFYWLPFDPFQRGYYELVLILQTWHCYICVWFTIIHDVLFCVLLSHLTTQYDLLAVRISKLFQVPVDKLLIESYPLAEYTKLNGKTLDSDAREKLQQSEMANIIRRHQALIRLSYDTEEMFSFALLLNFLNSSIIICFCGFCCVFVEKWNEVAYKIFLGTAVLQIWLLCWYGQGLINASQNVCESLYNSAWYVTSGKMKKCILFMIYRSQSEVYLTTYGFSVVSLASFTTIIKNSWSYFTLLINMYN